MIGPIVLHFVSTTREVGESADQVGKAFSQARSALSTDLVFSGFGGLWLACSLHPAVLPSHTSRGVYDRRSGDYLIMGLPVDYEAWVGGDWAARVECLAAAGRQGVARVAKTRITPAERNAAVVLIDRMAAMAAAAPPEVLAPVPPSDWRAMAAPSEPSMVKLYRKTGGDLFYDEVWIDEANTVSRHAGRCGERGAIERASHPDRLSGRAAMAAIVAEIRAAGFRPIPDSRHVTLVIDLFPERRDQSGLLDCRHALEERVDQELGWLGLGHCDGGDIGVGEASLFCPVVSYPLAAEAMRRLLDEVVETRAVIRRNR
jgi:hypothetical protein